MSHSGINEVMSLVGVVVVGLLALGVIGAVLTVLSDRRGRSLPYVVQTSLNTPAEQAFLGAVQRAVGSTSLIACKVRIADVLQVRFRKRHGHDQRWWRYFRLISAKHVDLVLCAPRGGRILVAIELDDRSHRRGDRKRRDRFVDRAFASAGVPLLRFAASGRYDAREIHERLAPYLTTSEEGSVICPNSRSTTR